MKIHRVQKDGQWVDHKPAYSKKLPWITAGIGSVACGLQMLVARDWPVVMLIIVLAYAGAMVARHIKIQQGGANQQYADTALFAVNIVYALVIGTSLAGLLL